MASIDLMLDEENELTFQLNIEGSRPAETSCRLLLSDSDMSYVFEGHKNNEGELSVILPSLKHVIKEGTYDMSLEVIVDDKYFKPLTMQGNFEKSITVSAQPITKARRKKTITSASLLEVKKPNKNSKPKRPTPSKKRIASEVSDDEIMSIIKALTSKK